MRRYFLRSAVSRGSRRTVPFRKGKSAASLSRSKSGIKLGQKPSASSRRRPAKGSKWKCGTVLPCTCKCVTGVTTLLLFTGAITMIILYFHKQRKTVIDTSSAMIIIREFMILQNESFKEKSDSEILDGVQHLAQYLSELKSRSEKVKKATSDIIEKLRQRWRPVLGNLYHISTTTKNAYEAEENCKQGGAHLVDIASPAEEKFFEDEMSKGGGKFYIGLRNEGNIWKWVTGEPLTISYWGPEEGDEAGGTCAVISKCVAAQKCWNKARCEEDRRWICKLKPDPMYL